MKNVLVMSLLLGCLTAATTKPAAGQGVTPSFVSFMPRCDYSYMGAVYMDAGSLYLCDGMEWVSQQREPAGEEGQRDHRADGNEQLRDEDILLYTAGTGQMTWMANMTTQSIVPGWEEAGFLKEDDLEPLLKSNMEIIRDLRNLQDRALMLEEKQRRSLSDLRYLAQKMESARPSLNWPLVPWEYSICIAIVLLSVCGIFYEPLREVL